MQSLNVKAFCCKRSRHHPEYLLQKKQGGVFGFQKPFMWNSWWLQASCQDPTRSGDLHPGLCLAQPSPWGCCERQTRCNHSWGQAGEGQAYSSFSQVCLNIWQILSCHLHVSFPFFFFFFFFMGSFTVWSLQSWKNIERKKNHLLCKVIWTPKKVWI